jgi:acyl transferase domain-containing protein
MPMRVPVGLLPWPVPEGERRVAGVNSFGLSGTNAHVILEEAPPAPPAEAVRGPWLLPLSARSSGALRSLAREYRDRLAMPRASLRDVCYSAGARRAPFEHRLALAGATGDALIGQIDA